MPDTQIDSAPHTYADAILRPLREPLLVLDAAFHVHSATPSFYETFHTSPEKTLGRLVFELDNGAWNDTSLRKMLADVLPNHGEFDNPRIDHDFPQIGLRTMIVSGRLLHDGQNNPPMILLVIEDITERRHAGLLLETSEIRYRRLFEAAHDGILIL